MAGKSNSLWTIIIGSFAGLIGLAVAGWVIYDSWSTADGHVKSSGAELGVWTYSPADCERYGDGVKLIDPNAARTVYISRRKGILRLEVEHSGKKKMVLDCRVTGEINEELVTTGDEYNRRYGVYGFAKIDCPKSTIAGNVTFDGCY